MLVAGICMFFYPFNLALGAFPLFGKFFYAIGTFLIAIIALVVGTLISFLTISLAWLFYRPLIALLLMTIIGAIIALFVVVEP